MQYVPFVKFYSSPYGNQVVYSVTALMLIFGLVSLLYGWKMYKIAVVVATGLAGACLGWYLVHGYKLLPDSVAFLGPLVLGLLGALAAIPLQKAAVFFIGAAVGFVSLGPWVADLIWKAPPGPTTTQYLILSAAGFVLMGVLSLFLFKPVVIVATSMLGATLTISAVVQFVERMWLFKEDLFMKYQPHLAFAYAVVVVFGVLFQATLSEKKKKKEP